MLTTVAAVFSGVVLQPSPQRAGAIERAWANLETSGPTLDSAQRISVIAGARRAWAGAEAPDTTDDVIGEASFWLAVDAEGITQDLIADFERRGLSRFSYLEIVGVIARLSNVDWYLRGIGASVPTLPQPDASMPTGRIAADAGITDSWVPMLGNASAPHTLDALPDEGDALRDLHEPMYVDMRSIEDWTLSDELSRVQIEFLAARTSFLNECFY
jgi:hypothetical protein